MRKPSRGLATLLWCLILGAVPAGCVQLSNKAMVERSPGYHGLLRVGVLLRHWPAYQQLPGKPQLDSDFISRDTPFFAALETARDPHPRAVDLAGLDDEVGEAFLEALRNRGYEPVLLPVEALVPTPEPLAVFLARQRLLTPELDAYLFCFYAPTLYVSHPDRGPAARGERSYTVEEMVRLLNPGRRQVLWAGPAASQAPAISISQAVVHLALTLFRAQDGRALWQVADSRVAGHPHGIVANCPPFPSREDYWTGGDVIRRLMRDNLRCRLHYLLPDAIPAKSSSDNPVGPADVALKTCRISPFAP